MSEPLPAFTVSPTSNGDFDSCVYRSLSDAFADAELVLDDCEPGTAVTIKYTPMTQKEIDALEKNE